MRSVAIFSSLFLMISACIHCCSGADDDEGWETYRANEYGFEMLMPKGAKVKEREAAGGWGGLYVSFEGVEFYGFAKLGSEEKAEDIEQAAVKETGIPDAAWKKVDEGKNEGGWKWYRVYEARKKGKVIYGASGVGPSGSYLLFLRTTKKDFDENKKDYVKWYESVRLFKAKKAGK